MPVGSQKITNYTPLKLKIDDILEISVNSLEKTTTEVFSSGENGAANYLIFSDGTIDFPLTGKIALQGLTTSEAKVLIVEKLNTFFVQPPIVNIRLMNFTININGEVGNPGSIQVNDEKFSLIDAITQAGDFTTYSRRDSIMIIREEGNIRSFGYVDFNDINILNSPYFYLQQNVVYIKPSKRKVATVRAKSTNIQPWVSAGVSLVILITTFARVFN